MTTIRVAVVRDDEVLGVHAFKAWTTHEEYLRDVVPLLRGPYPGAEAQALREDEHVALGDRRDGRGGWTKPKAVADSVLEQIDAQTDSRIEAGFAFRGVVVSLSLESQIRMIGVFQAREFLTNWPIRWNSLDDRSVLELRSPSDVVEFFAAGVAALRAAVDVGTAQKDDVRTKIATGEVLDVASAVEARAAELEKLTGEKR